MTDNPESPDETPRPTKPDDYEDRHYHDDEDVVPTDDAPRRGVRPPVGNKPRRRVPPPRRHQED